MDCNPVVYMLHAPSSGSIAAELTLKRENTKQNLPQTSLQPTLLPSSGVSVVHRYLKQQCSHGALLTHCHCMTTAAVLTQELFANLIPMKKVRPSLLIPPNCSAYSSHASRVSSLMEPFSQPACELFLEFFLWASWAMGSMPCSCFSEEDFGMWLVSSGGLSASA